MVAAGAAFFGLLALFPTLAAAVALYGLVTGPETVGAHIGQLEGFAPEEARMLLTDQLQRMTAASDRSLGVGALVALLLALWSSAKGVKSLMTALDIVYGERESRGFFKLNATALLLTLAMLIRAALARRRRGAARGRGSIAGARLCRNCGALAALAAARRAIGRRDRAALPVRARAQSARPTRLWPGAVVATALWLIASALFSWYVSSFGSYDETYGSVAALAVVMMWFWLSAFAVLIGGEVNAELERPHSDSSAR